MGGIYSNYKYSKIQVLDSDAALQDANGKRHSLSISSITCTARNSNIEILRIIAMLCIAFNHFPWPAQDIVGSGSFVERLPMSLLLSLISNLGGIGDCLFFFISAWYICEESANYKRQFKRVWILERELLFWSLLLLSGDLISQGLDLQETYSKKHLIKHIIIGIFPFSSNHWWFPTNYMMFLLVVPALSVGLKKTGKQLHKILSIILLIFFGFIPFGIVDRFSLGAPRIDYSLWLFIYQFVLVTYLRWYKSDWLKSKSLMLKFMWIGGACDVITQSIGATLISTTSNEYITTEFLWMNCASCIPTMMFALGLLASAQQKKQKHSRVIIKLLQLH